MTEDVYILSAAVQRKWFASPLQAFPGHKLASWKRTLKPHVSIRMNPQRLPGIHRNAACKSIPRPHSSCASRSLQQGRPHPAHRTLHSRDLTGVTIKTIAYNGKVPGPMLRLREGVPITIDVTNAATEADIVHWHGLAIDSLNDGAMEEGSPMIAAGQTHRYTFTPKPAGTRWYHTHAGSFGNLAMGTYTGQFGFLLVEGSQSTPQYDMEVNLAIHHWEPSFVPMVETMRSQSANMPLTTGSDVGYKYATINDRMLGSGEPIRVKQGQRILMRLLNASATENVVLALPGHRFTVLAMDGNPVPNPTSVETLSLAVAERVDALVEMNSPGVWILGSTLEKARQMGLGVVIEYAGQSGAPVWKDPVRQRNGTTRSLPAPLPRLNPTDRSNSSFAISVRSTARSSTPGRLTTNPGRRSNR